MITRLVAGNDSAFSFVRLQYGNNPTDTVSGMIIYPDDFSFAEAGVGMLPFGSNYAIRQIDLTTWEALEEAGCVFLPAQRYRYYSSSGSAGIDEKSSGIECVSWTATANAANTACFAFGRIAPNPDCFVATYSGRNTGNPVRLAQDL